MDSYMVSQRMLLDSHIMFSPVPSWFHLDELDAELIELQVFERKLPI